jgi:hypothetical protein
MRAESVLRSTNALLHPWLKRELSAILSELPKVETLDPLAPGREWAEWGWDEERLATLNLSEAPGPVRAALIWDNLKGHYTQDMVAWCVQQGIVPLYTPLGGSWLNLAESVQRIVRRRALEGQNLGTAEALCAQLDATIKGWNLAPTPFEWGGKRAERRRRARERRHALGGSGGYTRRPIPRRRRPPLFQSLRQPHCGPAHSPQPFTAVVVN